MLPDIIFSSARLVHLVTLQVNAKLGKVINASSIVFNKPSNLHQCVTSLEQQAVSSRFALNMSLLSQSKTLLVMVALVHTHPLQLINSLTLYKQSGKVYCKRWTHSILFLLVIHHKKIPRTNYVHSYLPLTQLDNLYKNKRVMWLGHNNLQG